MKVGEIWRYKLGIETLIDLDPDCYEPGDELVKITYLGTYYRGDGSDGYESVHFTHLTNTCSGVLPREEFLEEYERYYK